MKVLFDSNLWISFMIGKRLSSLADVLCHHDIEVYISEQQFVCNQIGKPASLRFGIKLDVVLKHPVEVAFP